MPSLRIVGILNTTPDSYFDGGKFNQIDAAMKRAGEMLSEGADIIEVGGESTGPGSADVSEEEERTRTINIIRAIKEAYPGASVSIDTCKASIATEAIDAGAMMVNDVTAGRNDPEMFSVVAERGVPLVLMYAKNDSPRTTIEKTQYRDVVASVKDFLRKRKEAAVAAGIDPKDIILDPGMGHFVSSDPQYSFELLARLPELLELGSPIFLSPSRKSFLAGSENLPVSDRLPGTIAASAIAVLHGASFIRTHDIAEVRRGCEIAASVSS